MTVCEIRLRFGSTGRSEVMSLVYRIQSKQNRTRGAYHAHRKLDVDPNVVKRMCRCHAESNKHLSPYFSSIGRDLRPNEFCGCESAAALLRWFKGFIPNLLRAGYEIVALRDVTITAVGEYQVLFTFND